MAGKTAKKARYNFLIDKQVYEDFSLICEELGLVRSKNIENYMKGLIEKHAELVKKLKGEKEER
ncbi:hypothetical protein KY339_01890 [Candidatus Woesearchaeota archaeon]|jgi:hypothetical protein|nr:hypothetical protein [Candidatus Woesearchaeota archaeon]